MCVFSIARIDHLPTVRCGRHVDCNSDGSSSNCGFVMTRHKSIERPPVGTSIEIDFNGQHFEGSYTVDGPMVTVESPALGTKRAPLGDGAPLAIARLLLAELAHAARTR